MQLIQPLLAKHFVLHRHSIFEKIFQKIIFFDVRLGFNVLQVGRMCTLY